jgi:hypothetical protein
LLGGGYVAVTDRRLIWTEWRGSVSLSFEQMLRAQEIFEETHRYRLRFLHEPIDRPRDAPLPWDLPHHFRRLRQRKTWNRRTELRFSRANTDAAEAIRRALVEAGVTLLEPVVRPHRRHVSDRTLYRIRPIRAWWDRRRFSRL